MIELTAEELSNIPDTDPDNYRYAYGDDLKDDHAWTKIGTAQTDKGDIDIYSSNRYEGFRLGSEPHQFEITDNVKNIIASIRDPKIALLEEKLADKIYRPKLKRKDIDFLQQLLEREQSAEHSSKAVRILLILSDILEPKKTKGK